MTPPAAASAEPPLERQSALLRPAAAAYLKGYQDYAKSQKAPESLLKLAMSLQRLGQKDAACSSFTEFATKYPTPPSHIKTLAQNERQRSGC